MEAFKNIKLILGSKSPRRCQLLKEAGFSFEIRHQDTEESFDTKMAPLEVAAFLAGKKADVLKKALQSGEVLITADSVVILDDKIYNKPENHQMAFEMLKALAGNEHCVATGVQITSLEKSVSFTSLTYVEFDQMDDAEIQYYIKNYKPFDKAGSYGIQDWIGLCKVRAIRGSYSNVMGLPIRDIYNAIIDFTR